MKKLITIILIFGISSVVFSQDNEMITDRPDATESPNIVPRKSLQIETGGYYTSYKDQGLKQETKGYNTTLFRYGLLDNFELRLGWNLEEGKITGQTRSTEDITSGFSPLLLGMKIALTEEKGIIPQIGLLGHLMLPFLASSYYRPETTGVDFRFAFAHTLSEKSGLSYNLGAQWGADSPEASYIYTLSYGYGITERFGAYVEVFGDIPEDNSSNHFWDAGITYSVKENIQLDATVGRSISEGQDLLLSAGISFRIPK